MKETNKIVDFLFEVGILSKTPRSGFHFLGTGDQSVAEHISRVMFIGYALSSMNRRSNSLKVLKMCLLHDVAESRMSDLNYVHQKYVRSEGERAIEDLAEALPFGGDMKNVIQEYEERESLESIIAKEADNLEWILSLKEEYDTGNKRAMEWIKGALKRLRTKEGKEIAKKIIKTDSNDWWFKGGKGHIHYSEKEKERLKKKNERKKP